LSRLHQRFTPTYANIAAFLAYFFFSPSSGSVFVSVLVGHQPVSLISSLTWNSASCCPKSPGSLTKSSICLSFPLESLCFFFEVSFPQADWCLWQSEAVNPFPDVFRKDRRTTPRGRSSPAPFVLFHSRCFIVSPRKESFAVGIPPPFSGQGSRSAVSLPLYGLEFFPFFPTRRTDTRSPLPLLLWVGFYFPWLFRTF